METKIERPTNQGQELQAAITTLKMKLTQEKDKLYRSNATVLSSLFNTTLLEIQLAIIAELNFKLDQRGRTNVMPPQANKKHHHSFNASNVGGPTLNDNLRLIRQEKINLQSAMTHEENRLVNGCALEISDHYFNLLTAYAAITKEKINITLQIYAVDRIADLKKNQCVVTPQSAFIRLNTTPSTDQGHNFIVRHCSEKKMSLIQAVELELEQAREVKTDPALSNNYRTRTRRTYSMFGSRLTSSIQDNDIPPAPLNSPPLLSDDDSRWSEGSTSSNKNTWSDIDSIFNDIDSIIDDTTPFFDYSDDEPEETSVKIQEKSSPQSIVDGINEQDETFRGKMKHCASI